MRNYLALAILAFIIGCGQHEYHTTAADLNRILEVVRQRDISILYNVNIKPRYYTEEGKHHLVRFQVNVNGRTYNIPVFNGDTLVSKNNYYDLYTFSQINNINSKDSALTYVKAYSNRIMDLYYKLNAHQIIGGLPHQGQLVGIKLLDGSEVVFVPDTNRIFSQYWRVNTFRNMERLTDSLYVSKRN
jgi:hypothetical protein